MEQPNDVPSLTAEKTRLTKHLEEQKTYLEKSRVAFVAREELVSSMYSRVKRVKKEIMKRDEELKKLRAQEQFLTSKADLDQKLMQGAFKKVCPQKEGKDSVAQGIETLIKHLDILETGKSGTKNDIKPIKIILNGFERKDSASFRCSPESTFQQLTEDACRFFSMRVDRCTLRNEMNELWPRQARVQAHINDLELRQEAMMAKTSKGDPARFIRKPQFRLVSREPVKHGEEPFRYMFVDFDGSSKTRKARSGTSGSAAAQRKAKQLKQEILARRDIYALKSECKPLMFHDRQYIGPSMTERITWQTKSESQMSYAELEQDMVDRMECHCCGCMLHLLFIITLVLSSMIWRGQVYEFNDTQASIANALERPFSVTPGAGSFASSVDVHSMETVEHVWAFLQGPLSDFILFDASTATFAPANQLYGFSNKTLMRQLRTDKTLGEVGSDQNRCGGAPKETRPHLYWGSNDLVRAHYKDTPLYCYPILSIENTASEWKGNDIPTPTSNFSRSAFEYGANACSRRFTAQGGLVLSDSGFALMLDSSNAAVTLTELQAAGWLDRSTRAIVISFNLLNRNYQDLTYVDILITFDMSGSFGAQILAVPYRLTGWGYGAVNGQRFTLLALADVYVFLWTMHLLFNRVIKGIQLYTFSKYVQTVWNCIDMINVATLFTVILCRLFIFGIGEVELDSEECLGFYDIANWYRRMTLLELCSIFLATINLLSLLQMNASLSKLWCAIVAIGKDLSVLIFFICWLALAVAMSAHITVGRKVEGFQDIFSSFVEALEAIFSWKRGTLVDAYVASGRASVAMMLAIGLQLMNVLVVQLVVALFQYGHFRTSKLTTTFLRKTTYRSGNHEAELGADTRTYIFWSSFVFGPVQFVKRKFAELQKSSSK